MVTPNAYTVQARDRTLGKLGDLGQYSTLVVTPNRNAVGAWQLTYPATASALDLIRPDGGIRVLLKGAAEPILTGPVSSIGEAVDDGSGGIPTVTVTGTCDNKHLANRQCWPMPTNDVDTQDSSAYYNASTDAETAMRDLVNLNAGPGALTRRRTTGLVLATPNGHRGSTVPVHVRFDPLLNTLADLALKGGDLTFAVKQIGAQLVFSVRQIDDVSRSVRFSTLDSSLPKWSYTKSAPTVTAVILGDSQADVGRLFVEYTNAADEAVWGQRIEAFQDEQATADPTQIAADAAATLASGAATYVAVFSPLEGPQSRYGIDYGLGSLVTVDLGPGRGTITQAVQSVTITDSTEQGLTVVPVVGPPGATNSAQASALAAFVKALAIRVGKIERYR